MCPLLCRLPGQAGHNASAVGCPVWGCAPLNQIHTCCRKKIKYWNCLGIFSPIFPFSFLYFFFIFGEGYLRPFTKLAFSAVAGVLFVSHTMCSRQKSLLGHFGKESCANPNPIPSLVPWAVEPLSRGQGTIPAGGWECWECLIPQDS